MTTCELCNATDPRGIRSGLACYADDGRFERIDRCTDHQACRDRVEAGGDDWPLADLTTLAMDRHDGGAV